MSSIVVQLSRFNGGNPPGFSGLLEDLPLNVTLDTSAVLKLAGEVGIKDRHDLLATKQDAIVRALQRLADKGQIDIALGRADMMLSALDFD